MKIASILLATLSLAAVGCTTITHELDRLSDDELASYLEAGAQKATGFGVKYAIKKNPDKMAQIQKDGTLGDQIIREVMIPAFTNSASGTVLKGAIDVAVAKLASKLSGSPIDTILMVADTLVAQVPLPKNPADKLSPRLQKAIGASFLGMAEGLEQALGIPSPVPTPVVPPPAPPPSPAPPPK